MDQQRSFRFIPAACVLLAFSACTFPGFNWATRSVAPWWYLQSEYGGLIYDGMTSRENALVLKFHLNKDLALLSKDGFYLYAPKATVDQSKIKIRIYKCIEYRAMKSNFSITLSPLPPGDYEIVYDDKLSSFPILGKLAIQN